MLLNAFRRLFSNSKNRKARRAYTRPQLLQLESRIVPANFQVTSLADTATGGTLREAIGLANTTAGNDTIDFASSLFSGGAGTITLLTAQLPTILSASTAISGGTRGTLTITGPGASTLTISGNNGVSTRDFRIFEIVSGGNLSISGVTVSGAKFNSNAGGAFLNNGGTLSISNSTLSDNSASSGGAIHNTSSGAISISNSTLSDNSAGASGGAIFNYYATLNISNSTLTNNSAGGAGAISNNNATLNISNSTLTNNSSGSGGAIYNIGTSTLSISNSTLSNNSTIGGGGGAIHNTSSGAISISNSTLSNNSSGTGGAIYSSTTSSGAITISNSTLSNNSATLYGGGAISSTGSTITISNSTLSNNSATTNGTSGGAIYNGGGTLNISNSTLSNNSATSASAISGGGFFVNTIFANSSNLPLVGAGTGTNNLITSGTYSWATTVSRASLNLGILQNNGGPTQTIALLSGSVAIGAGDAAISNAAPISGKDQRGYTRSFTAPSIGAYEFNGAAPAPAPTITSISPVTGSAAGGTTITITGTDFTGATAVNIGGVAASSFTVVNSTTITAITPAHAAGAASVEVTTATGTNVANTLFNYAATTTTALASSVNPSVFGQSVTFTATVTGSLGTPSGTITFKNGSTTLGTGTLNGSGVATFSTSSLPVGSTHSITAEYGGDASFVTSSSSANQVVNQASSATALASSVNPSVFGQSVTFTATVAAVSPGTGTATGSVEFFDGSTSLGIVTLTSGSATSAAITNFGVSTHSITAVYSGDSSFVTSTSSVVSQVVNLGTANTPTFGTPTSTANGFTVQISNYDANFAYAGTATASGTVAIVGSLVTVTGVAANTSSNANITTTQTNYANGSSTVTATSNVAPTPTPPAPSPTPTATPTAAPTPAPTPTTGPMITGTPPPPASSGSSTVNLYDPATGQPMATGTAVPFPGFDGPITVVSGDFNNDGVADLVAGAGFGGGPAIAILDSQTGQVMEAFWAFDPAFTGGVFVAVQDTNGDGILDIIASAGPGGGPEVRIFNGANLNLLRSFYAYDQSFTGGVSVATIDFNNDGILDLVTGAGPGGAPHVKVYDGATNAILSQWYAYPATFTGSIFVAVGDIGNDGNFEVVTGAGPTGAPVVAVWDPNTGALLAQFMAYAESFTGGVRVAVNDGNGDGIADIVTGAGPGGGPQVNVFNFPALDLLFSFYSGEATNPGGVFVS